MTAARVHLVRHGEVDNPDGILYGRLPGFGLTALGRRMAAAAADHVVEAGREVGLLRTSPLQRAVESTAPMESALGLDPERRDGLVEASSRLEGGRFDMSLSILGKPSAWRYLVNPLRPSWGEPFVQVAARMRAELAAAAADAPDGTDAVLVSHQLPIWMAHRSVTGAPLFHDPRKRRCALSSITSFEPTADGFREVSYWAPAPELLAASTDDGAV
ncbi:histidine phosphatase family protein [Clavibacter zhangzhiyongii]|uniref:histidine phosphatase family protein n=1 Tax=Clavibacter zhangzhiyongii TaxID=2768071 RepID=UPI0039E0AC19